MTNPDSISPQKKKNIWIKRAQTRNFYDDPISRKKLTQKYFTRLISIQEVSPTKKIASSWQQLVRESLAWCRIQLKAHKDKSAQSSIKILRSEKHTEALRNILLFNRSRTKKLFNNQNYLSVAVPESEDNCTLSTHIESTHHWNKWR